MAIYLHAFRSWVANRTQRSHVTLGREREEDAVRGGPQEAGLGAQGPRGRVSEDAALLGCSQSEERSSVCLRR